MGVQYGAANFGCNCCKISSVATKSCKNIFQIRQKYVQLMIENRQEFHPKGVSWHRLEPDLSKNQRVHMRHLPFSYSVGLSVLAVTIVSFWNAPRAEALTMERSGPASAWIVGISTTEEFDRGLTMGPDNIELSIVRDPSPTSIVRAELDKGLHVGDHDVLQAPRTAFDRGSDPFPWLFGSQADRSPHSWPVIDYVTTTDEDLPIVVSAGAVLLTSVLGWRLIAPPREPSRRKKRSRKTSSSSRHRTHDTESMSDVAGYVIKAITPKFLKPKRKHHRRFSRPTGSPHSAAGGA